MMSKKKKEKERKKEKILFQTSAYSNIFNNDAFNDKYIHGMQM